MGPEKTIAEAYHLRDIAEQKVSTTTSGDAIRSNLFLNAAHAFEAAATTVEDTGLRKTYYRICAECFANAGDSVRAARFFERAAEYDLSAKHYRAAGSFDDAVRLTKTFEDQMQSTVVENIIDISKLYYLTSGDIE